MKDGMDSDGENTGGGIDDPLAPALTEGEIAAGTAGPAEAALILAALAGPSPRRPSELRPLLGHDPDGPDGWRFRLVKISDPSLAGADGPWRLAAPGGLHDALCSALRGAMINFGIARFVWTTCCVDREFGLGRAGYAEEPPPGSWIDNTFKRAVEDFEAREAGFTDAVHRRSESAARAKAMNAKRRERLRASPGMAKALAGRTEAPPSGGWTRRAPSPPDPARAAEARAALDRLSALAAVRARLIDPRPARAADAPQIFTLLARGVAMDGGLTRAMAPTRQLAEMALGRGKNRGWVSSRQLAAAAEYAWLRDCSLTGRAGVDPEAIRVDGGGGGDMHAVMLNACRAVARMRAARAAMAAADRKRLGQRIADWVILADREIDGFALAPAEFSFDKADYRAGARRLAFLGALDALAVHFGY